MMHPKTPSKCQINSLKKQKYLEEVSQDKPKYRKIFEDAYASFRRGRVNHAQCLYCCCLDREAIRCCTAEQCPSWNGRPYQ